MELMVAASLLALGFFILVIMLIRVSGIMNRVVVVSQLQQNCDLTAARLSNFASRCDVGGVSFSQDPALTGLAVHPVREILGNHYKRYEPYITLFCWSPTNSTLVETHSLPLADDECWQPHKLDPDAIGILSLRPPSRVLSRSVTRMELYSPDQNCPVFLKMEFQTNAPGFGTQVVRLERYLNVRDVL